MFLGNDKGSELLNKEELRIQRKRENNEQRRLRLLDARRRVIGLDVEGLNAQVAEKGKLNCDKDELERLEKIRHWEIEKVLAAAAEEEVQMREFQKRELKKSWDEAVHRKTTRPKSREFNPEETGVSAAQIFQGEDRGYWDRNDRAKDQMKRWIQEQTAEKTYLQDKSKMEDRQYGEIMKRMDTQRGGVDDEEKAMREYLKKTINESNSILKIDQNRRKAESLRPFGALAESEILKATSLPIMEETPDSAVDRETGRIIRKDLFKGYTQAQTKRLWRENDKVRQDKIDRTERENNSDKDYALMQNAIQKQLEYNAFEEKAYRQELTNQQMKTLKEQIRDQQTRRELDKNSKFGSIDSQFFSNFGASCR